MEKSNAILKGHDRKGNMLEIEYKGVDYKELAHFGGLDLHVNTTKHLISSTLESISFAEKEGDFLIGDKVAALYLNEIGEFYRHCHSNPDAWEGMSNIEVIQYFIKEQVSVREVEAIIKNDEELMAKEQVERGEEEM
ncbi:MULTISPECIES: hypothetical protein [unclassified Planococcus (in: firmicutes)]|uniref:hypothetical protein n=1 Tax=unclassified Planococcus (in: firmicutes) TaxID=2662419 RepID=UPI000C79583B|nr:MULTISPECIES: hypothetical protein [unclassified Planococcus (in: firmicutes)]PKG46532.1 hypothetical protein CXF66_06555 [Planococcus sp. Urea-trap-24]PKG89782.1 hypothetical protein CXF91_06250 [Planococcus sp. Urea-3u-39]PKH40815.1 hypothetical protein CXF77_07145 [Planococcus sp. MB-3u-09]